jgi:hypothetical protein
MNEIHLSDYVQEQIKRYEAGRLEAEDSWRKKYAEAKKRRRTAIWIDLVQIFQSLITLGLKNLIEGIQDFRDALDAPLPFKVTKLERGDQESKHVSGLDGERRVLKELSRFCRKPCTALLGYHGAKGEIDIILVGRYGITAIEVKNITGKICCDGDSWWRIKFGQREEIEDRRGRSPSVQLNECADELRAILSSNGLQIPIRRIVVLAHPNAGYGNPFLLSVDWACKIEHLNRRVIFNPLPMETLDRDSIARICEVISLSHEREAVAHKTEQQSFPLYEEIYQNVERRPWRLRKVSAPKLLFCGFLMLILLQLGIARFAGLNRQKPLSVPTQTIHATMPTVKHTRRPHHKAATSAESVQ